MAVSDPDTPRGDPDLELTRRALRAYSGQDAPFTYDTLRLESRRTADEVGVHIYECHWSDIARAGSSVVQFFADLYQVLFRLSWLGYQNAAAGTPKCGSSLWNLYRRLLWVRCTALTVILPLIHVLLVAIVCIVSILAVFMQIPHGAQMGACVAVVAVLVGAISALVARRHHWNFGSWAVISLLPLLVAAACWTAWQPVASGIPAAANVRVFATGTVLFVGIGVVAFVRAFGRQHRQAPWFALALGTPFVVGLLFQIWNSANVPERLIRSCLLVALGRTATLTLDPLALISWLRYAWGALLLAFLVGEVVGHVAALLDRGSARTLYRSVRTASLTLALSVFGFVVTTTGLWGVLLSLVRRLIPAGLELVDHKTLADLSADLQTGEMVQFVSLFLLMVMSAAWILAWALFPSIAAEIRSTSGATESSEYGPGEALANWLNHGYRAMQVAGFLLYCPLLVGSVTAILWSLGIGSRVAFASTFQLPSATAIVASLTVLYSAILILFTPFGKLGRITSVFHELFRVILDVANHLREHPADSTPRARIAARLGSILRYVGDSHVSYQAIIIVAHSQGTIIVLDLLRWIKDERDRKGRTPNGDDSLPIYLFTMGSPLRQLYQLHFPFLYGWAEDSHKPSFGCWHPGDIGGKPDPLAAGLRSWTNVFGSGDYIGRQLWRVETAQYNYKRPHRLSAARIWAEGPEQIENVSSDSKGTRIEFCIGPLAHTRYLDGTAPEIGFEFDRLIGLASHSNPV
ncbi:MAG: hypothetical protein HY820_42675 [Acidobacteria bacterium]|nr:hypothetical protein [Acidobacteriota bacterium]